MLVKAKWWHTTELGMRSKHATFEIKESKAAYSYLHTHLRVHNLHRQHNPSKLLIIYSLQLPSESEELVPVHI